MLGKVIALIIAVIVSLVDIIFSKQPATIDVCSGGGYYNHIKELDPKKFIDGLEKGQVFLNNQPVNQINFANIQSNVPQTFYIFGKPFKWNPNKNIYNAGPDALHGETTYLMTPWLRQWQLNNIPPIINKYLGKQTNSIKIFDIGIGTGRSAKLWNILNPQEVSGIEPNKESLEILAKKQLPYFGKSAPLGGEDYKSVQSIFDKHAYNILMMSYSITFFVDKKADQLKKTIDYLLKPGGLYIGIGMDGSKIKEWFHNDNEPLDNNLFKMSLSKNKKEITLTLKNKFTLVENQKEYLIDVDEFLNTFIKNNDYKLIKKEHLVAPYYLTNWAKKWVEAQFFFCLQKN